MLKENWEVEIEPKDNRNFKPDIVIKSKDKTRAWIIDPTIRTEISNEDIEMKNREKQVKYEPTAVQLRAEGYAVVAVKGLWIGARGIMSNEGKILLISLGFDKKDFQEIICTVLKLSYSMHTMFMS